METRLASAIVISEQDSVATATRNIKAGEKVMVSSGGKEYELLVKDDINFLVANLMPNHRYTVADLDISWAAFAQENARTLGQDQFWFLHRMLGEMNLSY